jgi:putative ATP-dependent endonuclease of the OLD family
LARFSGVSAKPFFAVYDKQTDVARQAQIVASVDHAYEAPTKGFENLLLNETAEAALRRFAAQLVADGEWPPHLAAETPQAATPLDDLKNALRKYLGWSKGSGGSADLLGISTVAEMPTTLKAVLASIKGIAEPAPTPVAAAP